jgi:hypothetical protein
MNRLKTVLHECKYLASEDLQGVLFTQLKRVTSGYISQIIRWLASLQAWQALLQ